MIDLKDLKEGKTYEIEGMGLGVLEKKNPGNHKFKLESGDSFVAYEAKISKPKAGVKAVIPEPETAPESASEEVGDNDAPESDRDAKTGN